METLLSAQAKTKPYPYVEWRRTGDSAEEAGRETPGWFGECFVVRETCASVPFFHYLTGFLCHFNEKWPLTHNLPWSSQVHSAPSKEQRSKHERAARSSSSLPTPLGSDQCPVCTAVPLLKNGEVRKSPKTTWQCQRAHLSFLYIPTTFFVHFLL